jgi:hypothetical protein
VAGVDLYCWGAEALYVIFLLSQCPKWPSAHRNRAHQPHSGSHWARLCGYLHHFPILAPVQCVQLVGSELVGRGRGGAPVPALLSGVVMSVQVLLVSRLLVYRRGGVRQG